MSPTRKPNTAPKPRLVAPLAFRAIATLVLATAVFSACGSNDKPEKATADSTVKAQQREVQVLPPVPSVAEIAVSGDTVFWFGGRRLYSHDLKTGRRQSLLTLPKKTGYEGLRAGGGRAAFRVIKNNGNSPTAVYLVDASGKRKTIKGKRSCGGDVMVEGFAPDGSAIVRELQMGCSKTIIYSFDRDGKRSNLFSKRTTDIYEFDSPDLVGKTLVLGGKTISTYDLESKRRRTLVKAKRNIVYWPEVSPRGNIAATEFNNATFKDRVVLYRGKLSAERPIRISARKRYAVNLERCGERTLLVSLRNSYKRPYVELQTQPGRDEWTNVLQEIDDKSIGKVISWGCDAETLVLGVTRKGEKQRRLVVYPIA